MSKLKTISIKYIVNTKYFVNKIEIYYIIPYAIPLLFNLIVIAILPTPENIVTVTYYTRKKNFSMQIFKSSERLITINNEKIPVLVLED